MNCAAALSIPVQEPGLARVEVCHSARAVAICAAPYLGCGGRRKAFEVRN